MPAAEVPPLAHLHAAVMVEKKKTAVVLHICERELRMGFTHAWGCATVTSVCKKWRNPVPSTVQALD